MEIINNKLERVNTKTSLLKKLAKIKASLKLKKELKNKFGGFNYASIDSILKEVNQKLDDEGMLLNITEFKASSDYNYTVKAVLTDGFENFEFNYELHGVVMTGKGQTYKLQDCGGAITYVTRYIYGMIFSIPFEDDSINKNAGNKEYKEPQKVVWLDQKQLDKVKDQKVEGIKKWLKIFNSGTLVNGKVWKIQPKQREELEKILEEKGLAKIEVDPDEVNVDFQDVVKETQTQTQAKI